MSRVLQPHRGSIETMSTTKRNLILKKGEFFMEKQEDGSYRFKVGDGITVYSELPYSDGGNGDINMIIDQILSNTSENPVQNKVIYNALENKADKNHTHSNYALTNHTHSGYISQSDLTTHADKAGTADELGHLMITDNSTYENRRPRENSPIAASYRALGDFYDTMLKNQVHSNLGGGRIIYLKEWAPYTYEGLDPLSTDIVLDWHRLVDYYTDDYTNWKWSGDHLFSNSVKDGHGHQYLLGFHMTQLKNLIIECMTYRQNSLYKASDKNVRSGSWSISLVIDDDKTPESSLTEDGIPGSPFYDLKNAGATVVLFKPAHKAICQKDIWLTISFTRGIANSQGADIMTIELTTAYQTEFNPLTEIGTSPQEWLYWIPLNSPAWLVLD